MKHELKCWPEYFQAVKEGRKTFEIRKWDKPYAVGDILELYEWDNLTRQFTDEKPLQFEVTYLLDLTYLPGDNTPHFASYVCMSIKPVKPKRVVTKEWYDEIVEGR
jgi:hypothetical protein